jgi:benzil reductase ((S)-benzoin forming)
MLLLLGVRGAGLSNKRIDPIRYAHGLSAQRQRHSRGSTGLSGLALITGGSRGLGEALLQEYRSRDWSVLGFSRSGSGVHLDLADTVDAADVFTEAFARISALAFDEVVVISNAAVLGPVGAVVNTSPESIASHFDVNVVSGVLLARAFIGALQDRDCPKTFVNISSGAATKGYAGWSLYCASKAAMEGFVRSVALEQSAQAHPIRAINVNPGVMDTAMQAEVRASRVEDFPQRERFVGLKLGGGLSQPELVAARIADLIASRPEPGATIIA